MDTPDRNLPTQSGQRAKPTTPELSPRLSWLLTEAGTDAALEEIGDCPALFREAQDALPALRAFATDRAGDSGVRSVIGKRFVLFPQPDRSAAEWAIWWADYVDALGSLPVCALEAAMSAYVKTDEAEFMPKPGRLLALAKTTPNRGAQAYERCLKVTTGRDPERVRYEPSDDEKAQVRKMLAEFQVKVAERTVEHGRPPLPSIAGKPDETGITAAMRELMERRNG